MNRNSNKATEWIYGGIWRAIVRWFKVPDTPPTLPIAPNQDVKSFKPAAGYLNYLKFEFWFLLFFIDLAIVIGWITLVVFQPFIGTILTPFTLLIILVPNIVIYIGLHLKFDTTWYVLTNRSIRIRRGIWEINEMTFTFENIQNVTLKQGPLQRYYGISDVLVETAGGGGSKEQQGPSLAHLGRIEGVCQGPEIRDLILNKLQKSRTHEIGKQPPMQTKIPISWRTEHLSVLKSIRDNLKEDLH